MNWDLIIVHWVFFASLVFHLKDAVAHEAFNLEETFSSGTRSLRVFLKRFLYRERSINDIVVYNPLVTCRRIAKNGQLDEFIHLEADTVHME